MLRLQELDIVESKDQLALIPEGKVLINTIYAYSYVVAQRDDLFARTTPEATIHLVNGLKTDAGKLPALSMNLLMITGNPFHLSSVFGMNGKTVGCGGGPSMCRRKTISVSSS